MTVYSIPQPAASIPDRTASILLRHFPKDAVNIGSGTALAARWSHRKSTDIDITLQAQVFRTKSPFLRDRLKAAGIGKMRGGSGWLNGVCEEGDFSIGTTENLLPSDPQPDLDEKWGYPLDSVREILARKFRLSMYGNGEFVSKDFYDILTAREKDPGSPHNALETLTADERQEIEDEILGYGKQAMRPGRELTDVHRPDWLDDLGKMVAMAALAERPPEAGTVLKKNGDRTDCNPPESSPFGNTDNPFRS